MTAKLKATITLLALNAALGSGAALAYEKGDIIVRAGIAKVDPDSSSSALFLDGTELPGTGVSVDSNEQLGLTGTYMLTSNVGIELLAATPYSHTVTAHGSVAGLGSIEGLEVADVKHLPPTLSVQYYPLGSDSKLLPYVGAGINYTIFFDEKLTSDFKGTPLGDGSIDLDNSIGLAFEIGFDYAVTDKILVNAAVWNVYIDTEATIKLDAGSTIKTDVDIDPWVYMVGVGYKF